MTLLTLICAVVTLAAITAARLERILRLESGDLPDRVERWAVEVETLAADLTGHDPSEPQTALLRWLQDSLGLGRARPSEIPDVARRRDALHDVVADAAKLADSLRRFAHGARQKASGGQPVGLNLLALMRTRVNWRASDIYKSAHCRHAARQRPLHPTDHPATNGVNPATVRVLLSQITRRFSDDAVLAEALPLKFAGHADAAIARQTGHSRPKVQRALKRFRDWLSEDRDE